MKKLTSLLFGAALLLGSTQVMADEGDVICSHDFASADFGSDVTWTATSKKPSGYSYAQIGRGANVTLADGVLSFTNTTSKNGTGNNWNVAVGVFSSDIQTATNEKNYKLSFDATMTYNLNKNYESLFEISNANKQVILALYATHASTGVTYSYIVGGNNGFQVKEAASTSSANAEGTMPAGTKVALTSSEETTLSKTFSVTMDVDQLTSTAKLTIKEGETTLVDGVSVTVDATAGLKYIAVDGVSSAASTVSTIALDNFSIVEGAASAAKTATFSVNYLDEDNNVLKEAETLTGAVGTNPIIAETSKASFTVENQKYIYKSDNASSVTIAEDNSTAVYIIFRKAATWNATLKDDLGNVLGSGSGFEGDNVTIAYPIYQIRDKVLYKSSKLSSDGKGYYTSIALTEDNVSKTATFTAQSTTNALYIVEGESLEGTTLCTTGNAAIRASVGKVGYNATENNIDITTLAPGTYKAIVGVFDANKTASLSIPFMVGETEYDTEATTATNLAEKTLEFTVNENATLSVKPFGNKNAGLDYLIITGYTQSTVNAAAEGYYAYSNAETAFTVSGADVYYAPNAAEGSSIKLTKVEDGAVIPANAGVIFKAAAKDDVITITPSTSTATTLTGNQLVAVSASSTDPVEGFNYVLGSKEGTTALYSFTSEQWTSSLKTALVGKCYLSLSEDMSSAAKALTITFDETTGINQINELTKAQVNGAHKYIENGRLVISKNGMKYNAAGALLK